MNDTKVNIKLILFLYLILIVCMFLFYYTFNKKEQKINSNLHELTHKNIFY